MNNKRYTIQLGLNYEIEDIIDHCKQDKHLSVHEFLNQVNEQDKAFKKLKKENGELKSDLTHEFKVSKSLRYVTKELMEENEKLKQRINSRLHFYRGLYESTNDKVVERVIEDLEDILKR